jgi:C4-dicarboxylate-specific signal transduction histidine kinase
MGQLSASIAHEMNQPITAAVTNADAALCWLSAAKSEGGPAGSRPTSAYDSELVHQRH